ncbi:MAG: hypothetical protein JJ939_13200 [Alphaproteobacteria bacterium]|jgi:hypothetical protein|nr:hypothetical protein [Alphaproteobacteria bacterium]MBO6629371.1 hypothetical protein [Alphaproteobacteria bacterium]MDF1626049.1 hypothetical protein [Parvibaculaceae bacterium]|tara:strand:- start:120 stop:752 length:633 start_codon:yes stop_codon:yes gene_type:complete
MLSFLGVIARLTVPVVALLAVFALADLGSARFVTQFDVFPPEQWYLNPGYWLTYGHVALPLIFLVLNLVNRRYGPGLTIGSVMVSWVVIGAALAWGITTYGLVAVENRVATVFVAATFAGALFAGQLICIYLFDQMRGIPWWRAPFYGALWGGLAFAGFFYGQMAYGAEEPWTNRLAVMAGIYSAAAFVNLFLYLLMRRFIQPLPGFGGA